MLAQKCTGYAFKAKSETLQQNRLSFRACVVQDSHLVAKHQHSRQERVDK